MRMTFVVFAAAVVALGGLAVLTQLWVRRIEHAHPPTGRFVQAGSGRIHILELGPPGATPVVLLHGASGNLADMRLALGDRLAARYRVILIDRPGHGWSDRPDGRADASPGRQAELIHEVLQRIGVTRAIVLGHSWSGALATAYALNYPEAVSGLVLLAPVTHPWPGGVGWFNPVLTTPVIGSLFAHTIALPLGEMLIGPAVRAVFAPQSPPPDYIKRAGAELVLRPAELIANAEDLVDLKAFVTAQAPRYGDIETRTVIITGEADKIVSPRIHSEAIATMLPHARLILLPGVGHMVHFAATDRVVGAIDDLAAGRLPPQP